MPVELREHYAFSLLLIENAFNDPVSETCYAGGQIDVLSMPVRIEKGKLRCRIIEVIERVSWRQTGNAATNLLVPLHNIVVRSNRFQIAANTLISGNAHE